MPNLIQTYARSTGLKISDPWVKQDFWPLPFDRYITLSAGSGQAAKNYSHYQLVIDLLNPILAPLGMHIVQLGDDKVPLFSGTYDLRGKMTVAQASYLVKRAAAHLGNDSWSAHVAGYFGTPLVALYGTTDKVLHGPHWQNGPLVLLESHRWGRKPTFGSEGSPKSIDTIPPETVATAILKLLGIQHTSFAATRFIGPLHPHTIFDWIPNAPPPNLSPDIPLTVRMDVGFHEPNLLALLKTGRKVTIVTAQSIDLQLLATFRQSILSYSHEISDTCPLDYPTHIKRLIPNSVFFSRTKEEDVLSRLRFRYFDSCTIEHVPHSTKVDYLRENASYLNISEADAQKSLDNDLNAGILSFKTNKFVLSDSKAFLSYAHLAAGQSTPDLAARAAQVIDTEEFWRDLSHYHIYASTN